MVNNEFLEDFVTNFDAKFYDMELASEFDRQIVRIYVTSSKDDNISLDTCSKISRALSPILDATPILSGEYILEVSSPGLERKLKSIRQFNLSIGCDVKLTTIGKEKFIAKIIGTEENIITLLRDEEEIKIDFNDIKKARTHINWGI